jgi:hypothetical protein
MVNSIKLLPKLHQILGTESPGISFADEKQRFHRHEETYEHDMDGTRMA